MLLTVGFRLMFCNFVSKEGSDRKKIVITNENYIF